MNNVSKKAARHDKRAKKQDERRGGKVGRPRTPLRALPK